MSESITEDTVATNQLRIVLRESGILFDAAQTRGPLYSLALAKDKRAITELEEMDQITDKMKTEKSALQSANLRHDLTSARAHRDQYKRLETELYDLLVQIRLTEGRNGQTVED